MNENAAAKNPLGSTSPKRFADTAEAAVIAKIKELILTKGLRSGDPLPTESELCRTLGISRSSVREALRTLEALNIVLVRRGVGAFVGTLSMSALVETIAFKTILLAGDDLEALREVVAVRRYLDMGLAEAVCQALQGTSQPGLQALVSLMEERALAGMEFAQADFAFHDGILAQLNNDLMRQLVASFWQVHLEAIPTLGNPSPDSLQATAKAHESMLTAARSGNVEAYKSALEAHYAPLEDALRGARVLTSQNPAPKGDIPLI